MTNQLTALKELAEDLRLCKPVKMKAFRVALETKGRARSAYYAYSTGSLDSLVKLQRVILGDEWIWSRSFDGEFVLQNKNAACTVVGAKPASIPARAWLLAIIKAKIWELEQ